MSPLECKRFSATALFEDGSLSFSAINWIARQAYRQRVKGASNIDAAALRQLLVPIPARAKQPTVALVQLEGRAQRGAAADDVVDAPALRRLDQEKGEECGRTQVVQGDGADRTLGRPHFGDRVIDRVDVPVLRIEERIAVERRHFLALLRLLEVALDRLGELGREKALGFPIRLALEAGLLVGLVDRFQEIESGAALRTGCDRHGEQRQSKGAPPETLAHT